MSVILAILFCRFCDCKRNETSLVTCKYYYFHMLTHFQAITRRKLSSVGCLKTENDAKATEKFNKTPPPVYKIVWIEIGKLRQIKMQRPGSVNTTNFPNSHRKYEISPGIGLAGCERNEKGWLQPSVVKFLINSRRSLQRSFQNYHGTILLMGLKC